MAAAAGSANQRAGISKRMSPSPHGLVVKGLGRRQLVAVAVLLTANVATLATSPPTAAQPWARYSDINAHAKIAGYSPKDPEYGDVVVAELAPALWLSCLSKTNYDLDAEDLPGPTSTSDSTHRLRSFASGSVGSPLSRPVEN